MSGTGTPQPLELAGDPALDGTAQLNGIERPQKAEGATNGSAALPSPTASSDEPIGPSDFAVGWAQSHGNRPYQDDRCVEFLLPLPGGGSALVWAVADGHHQHFVSEMVCEELEGALREAVEQQPSIEEALRVTIRRLDDTVFARHHQGRLSTGGTTLIVHVLTSSHVYTANVGDCKSVLSSRGACVELNTCHNPIVPSERERFQRVGIYCSADHIGGSDINVCRTLGDYDLGLPLKGRDEQGHQLGPLISEPEVCVVPVDDLSEFVITASDGLWDYYSPESSVLSDTRRQMRRLEDTQAVAEWLLEQALVHQRRTLHAGTPGDNITVMVVQLKPLPPLPRASASRLNLRSAGSGELVSPKLADVRLPESSPGWEPVADARQQQMQRQASQQEALLRQNSSAHIGLDQLAAESEPPPLSPQQPPQPQ